MAVFGGRESILMRLDLGRKMRAGVDIEVVDLGYQCSVGSPFCDVLL